MASLLTFFSENGFNRADLPKWFGAADKDDNGDSAPTGVANGELVVLPKNIKPLGKESPSPTPTPQQSPTGAPSGAPTSATASATESPTSINAAQVTN